MEKPLPKIENFLSSDGKPLRKLFATAVMRALSPAERQEVLHAIRNY